MADTARFTRLLTSGQVLFSEGDPGNSMFVIRSGQVRITKAVRGGVKTLAVLGAGEFFGEMAILNDQIRSATATAVGETTLLEVDAKRFEGMVTSQAEIAVRLIQKLARRLDAADSLIAILTKRDAKTRVILGLQREALRAGMPGSTEESVLVTRDLDELSEELGVRREEMDEAIGRLIRVRVVQPHQEGLEIASMDKLAEFLTFLEDRGIVAD